MPAQTVDATPSNALIRQCFPGRSDLFGCSRSKPGQGSVPTDLTLASDLAFVFNASRVRLECCVDPLRPPRLSGHRPEGRSRPELSCGNPLISHDLRSRLPATRLFSVFCNDTRGRAANLFVVSPKCHFVTLLESALTENRSPKPL